MTQLARLAVLGLAKETTNGTYVAPTDYIPTNKCDFEDQIMYLRDESWRGNDVVLQSMYPGAVSADFAIDLDCYPDVVGHFLRAMIGPDTVSAGVSTTLSSSSSIGATSISVAASIAMGSYISIDTATAQEYAKVTAVSGSGPYTLTVTTSDSGSVGLANAHTSGATVVSQTTHTIKQSSNLSTKATYSLSIYDTVQTLGFTGAVCTDLDFKIDPKGKVGLSTKWKSLPSVTQSALTPAYSTTEPFAGWEWTMTNAGGSSTRGLSYDVSFKRAVDIVNSSDGTQGCREIFSGAMGVDGNYKAIFENTTDLNLYLNNTQLPATATMQQPIRAGGHSIALTMSKSGWSKGKRDWGATYVQADFSLSGIYNATDGGVAAVVLKNYRTSSY